MNAEQQNLTVSWKRSVTQWTNWRKLALPRLKIRLFGMILEWKNESSRGQPLNAKGK